MDNEKREKMKIRVKATDDALRQALEEISDFPAMLVSCTKLMAVLIDRFERKGNARCFMDTVAMLNDFREIVKDPDFFVN